MFKTTKVILVILVLSLSILVNTNAAIDAVSGAGSAQTGTISHFTFLDIDGNGVYDIGEQILKDLEVRLYDADQDELLSQFEVLDQGRFYFKNLSKGNYYLTIVFTDQKRKNTLEAVDLNQFVKNPEASVFKTNSFDFDPARSTRKDMIFPFKEISSSEKQLVFVCSDFIDSSYLETTIENCDNTLAICLEEPIGEMLSYAITDNGVAYTGGISPCDFDTSYAYTYASIPGGGTVGAYYVNGWSVDGEIYEGIVPDMSSLSDSMNTWDLEGNWVHDGLTATIRGGNTAVTYGSINITQIDTGDPGTIEQATNLNPNGTQLTLDTGYHQLIFTEPIEGCLDTLEVLINCIPCLNLYSGVMEFDLDNCNQDQVVCLDLTADAFLDYTVESNGLLYNDPVNACSMDSFYRYDYSVLPSGGTQGPYLLQNWTVNGTVYLGGFNTVGDLTDSMNVWDPGANWEISDPLQVITGGNPESIYSDIQVIQILSGELGLALSKLLLLLRV